LMFSLFMRLHTTLDKKATQSAKTFELE